MGWMQAAVVGKNSSLLQQLGGGTVLLGACLRLPAIARCCARVSRHLATGEELGLSATAPVEALLSSKGEVNLVWQVLSLLTPPAPLERPDQLVLLTLAVIYAAVNVMTAASMLTTGGAPSTGSKQTSAKDEEHESSASSIVETAVSRSLFSLDLMPFPQNTILSSPCNLSQQNVLQNLHMVSCSIILEGLRSVVHVSRGSGSKTPDHKSGQMACPKPQAGSQKLGVLAVALCGQALSQLKALLEDLDPGTLGPAPRPPLDMLAPLPGGQRVAHLAPHLSPLLFTIAALAYRKVSSFKACMLKRIQKNTTDGDAFSTSDSNTYYEDDFSTSDDTSEDDGGCLSATVILSKGSSSRKVPDLVADVSEEDSEPLLGQWFEETLAPQENKSETQAASLASDTSGKPSLPQDNPNLIPDKGEPHGCYSTTVTEPPTEPTGSEPSHPGLLAPAGQPQDPGHTGSELQPERGCRSYCCAKGLTRKRQSGPALRSGRKYCTPSSQPPPWWVRTELLPTPLSKSAWRDQHDVSRPLRDHQILHISRILLFFEYMIKNLYETPPSIYEQVSPKAQDIPSASLALTVKRGGKIDGEQVGITGEPDLVVVVLYVLCLGVLGLYIRPKFYALIPTEYNCQDAPKLDGFACSFLLGNPTYPKLYDAVLNLLRVAYHCDQKDSHPTFLVGSVGLLLQSVVIQRLYNSRVPTSVNQSFSKVSGVAEPVCHPVLLHCGLEAGVLPAPLPGESAETGAGGCPRRGPHCPCPHLAASHGPPSLCQVDQGQGVAQSGGDPGAGSLGVQAPHGAGCHLHHFQHPGPHACAAVHRGGVPPGHPLEPAAPGWRAITRGLQPSSGHRLQPRQDVLPHHCSSRPPTQVPAWGPGPLDLHHTAHPLLGHPDPGEDLRLPGVPRVPLCPLPVCPGGVLQPGHPACSGQANWNLYQQNTNEDFRKAPTRIKDLEQNWISFKNTIIKAAKVSIPRGNIKKWIPNYTHQAKDIQILITKRNELQKKCTQNQTNCRTELNIVNAKIKRLYVNMKREKWKQTCENLNPRNPNTKLWHLAKQIDRAQPQTENTNMIKNTDGTPATNDKNAANLLGNSYQISSKIKFEIKDKKVEKKARKIIHDCKNVTSTHNIFHEKINMKELDYALENTDLNKTPGPDGIHGQMISNLGKNGKEKLLDIFNNSWKTGKLPQDWKTATIIPIKKLDKSADDPKNYRPISLKSICCKLMEKIILRRLTYHLDTRNLLPKEQYGFRKGHGTIDQLLFFTQKVKDAQNRKPTNHTIAAFLDLTQAFDKVWKNKLITKLYKHFKIDGKAITWINDFLKNRYIRVKYNGTLSKTFKLYQGLPQGSVLSPTLFTLFIAGIEEKILHNHIFADDIILWSSNTNWKKAERDLNKTLFHLEKFANKHKLEFNPQKSETCLFTTDKKLYKIRPKIILKEQQLQYNKHPKYLGYTLDPEINSSKHIEEVIRKGRDRLKILKYISGREWGADATTLKLTYTSLIRPILEYGYQIYGTASETNLKSLERIQLSAARIITGLRNTCPNDIVLYEADIMPLKDRRSYNLPKYINKIKSYGNKHRTSKYILNWESNLRLKKEGPLHLAKRNEFLKYKVEKNYLAEKISPCKPLQNVIFNATLNEPTNKQYQNPEYLKQLSLEIINNIPKNAITIYTDGSRDELGHTGSGCLIKTTNGIEKMNRRNPDFCSVFRSELIAIYEALKSIRNTNYQNIWILTDSRSAIQHLSHTGELRDKCQHGVCSDISEEVSRLLLSSLIPLGSKLVASEGFPEVMGILASLARSGAGHMQLVSASTQWLEQCHKYLSQKEVLEKLKDNVAGGKGTMWVCRYHCHTCKMVDGVGVCTICAKICHRDHDVTYAKYGSFFCDCGAKEDGSCQGWLCGHQDFKPPITIAQLVVMAPYTQEVWFQALVKRGSHTGSEGVTTGPTPFPFPSDTILPSSIRRRPSSLSGTAAADKSSPASGEKSATDEALKSRLSLAKQLEVSCPVVPPSLGDMVCVCWSSRCATPSSWIWGHIQQAIQQLHTARKRLEVTDQLMVPTLGSQEGAFENVRMTYSGDQGQTIRQLISAHMIRRVAMCCLASPHGKRQHLAVSHEKGKRLSAAPVPFLVLSITGNPINEDYLAVCGLKYGLLPSQLYACGVTVLLLQDAGGVIGEGGIALYYSHVLQLLCFSYADGHSFIAPFPQVVSELRTLFPVGVNGGGKSQVLSGWMEVAQHPGLIIAQLQASNNPVVIAVKPDTILCQEIKFLTTKSKITDMVALRHINSNGEPRTTLILLCEDGSLRIFMANPETTSFWLMPPFQTTSVLPITRSLKKKKTVKSSRTTGVVSFPIDFFEHCTALTDIEFGGNDVLQVYNVQQVKHRLNTSGLFITSTKPAGFTIEVINQDSSMVMVGARFFFGNQDSHKVPSYVEIFGRTLQINLVRNRWFDFPFTREESLTADKRFSIFFGASTDTSGATIVDSIKIYGKTKESFGWPDDEEFTALGSMPQATPLLPLEGFQALPLPLTALDKLILGCLKLLDGCFFLNPEDSLKPTALGMATQLLTLPTAPSLHQAVTSLLLTLHPTRAAYCTHKDQAILSHILRDLNSTDTMDGESFYRLLAYAREVAVSRPHNLVHFTADASPGFLNRLDSIFWHLFSIQPQNPAITSIAHRGLAHVETTVQAMVEIIHAFTVCDIENVTTAAQFYVRMLISDNTTISFAAKQAILRVLRPKQRRRRVFIPSPPHCVTPGNVSLYTSKIVWYISVKVGWLTSRRCTGEESVHPADSGELLEGEALIPSIMDYSNFPPEADEDTMVELAIALSLQEAGAERPPQSDEEGSTAATDGSTLRTSPAEQGGSESGGSGAEWEHSGRSSAYGDLVAPASASTPAAQALPGSAPIDMDGHALRLQLLDRFLLALPKLRNVGGLQAIPFMQVLVGNLSTSPNFVVLMLSSDLLGDEERDKVTLDNLLTSVLAELDFSGKDIEDIAQRTPQREVQLILLRFLSIMMTRSRAGRITADSFCTISVANTLAAHGAVEYCLQVLKVLLDYWKNVPVEEKSSAFSGNLLKRHSLTVPPDMAPFFLRQYVKGHASDIFEAYPQLLTDMALRIPYQTKKCLSTVTNPANVSFSQVWFLYLCEYMMMPQTPFVRRQVRKLLLFICGSKDKYRQLRDFHSFESHMKDVKVICHQGEPDAAKNPIQGPINLSYDSLVDLIEHLKACNEIATFRTGNWQRYCQKDESILPFLINTSFLLNEGVSPVILHLCQTALCGAIHQGSKQVTIEKPKPYDEDEEDDNPRFDPVKCLALTHQVNKFVEKKQLRQFILCFLLESNSTAVRWQAHSLIFHLYKNSPPPQHDLILDLMWKLWPQLPMYGRKAAQFVDLLGYFTLKMPPHSEKKEKDYIEKSLEILHQQSQLLVNHPNSNIYNTLQGLVEFDGYYLESEPCLVCNNPEIPFSNIKLSSIKMDSRFTTTTQIVKLIGSHTISKIILRITDIKRNKMLRTLNIYYNNRTVQSVVELKNKPYIWHKAKRCSLTAGQTELKVEFPLPIIACNLMMEYADFYENMQASSETLQCPRCSASVPSNPGVCASCGENVFQCHKCRAINYDEKDPFLCNSCGFCKDAKFEYSLMCKPCCAVDPIETEEDRKKTISTINSLLEKADQVYRQLMSNKPILEHLIQRIADHGMLDKSPEDTSATPATTTTTTTAASSYVNKAIQQLAQRYCSDCKSSFDELSKIMQKVSCSLSFPFLNIARTLHNASLSAGAGGVRAQTERGEWPEELPFHPQQLWEVLRLRQCSGGALPGDAAGLGLQPPAEAGPLQPGPGATAAAQLHRAAGRRAPPAVSADPGQPPGNRPIQLSPVNFFQTWNKSMLEGHSLVAQLRVWLSRCVVKLFLLGINSKNSTVVEYIALPCLKIILAVIKPENFFGKKNKDKTVETLTSIKIAGESGGAGSLLLIENETGFSSACGQDDQGEGQGVLPDGEVSAKMAKEDPPPPVLGQADSQQLAETGALHPFLPGHPGAGMLPGEDPVPVSNMWLKCDNSLLCLQFPNRKKAILDLLTSYLDDVSGENAAEFLELYQSLLSSWKLYLALQNLLPHLAELITREIERLSRLEEITFNSDLSQGFALKAFTEILESFVEVDPIRQQYKGRLVGCVLNGYLSLRKLSIQRTKLIDETQDKLLELLEQMTTGETHCCGQCCQSSHLAGCGRHRVRDPGLHGGVCGDCQEITDDMAQEENDIGEFFVTLEKDPQQEDFLQGRMLGNPYSSAEVGPLMRDVKNKICQDCELVALLEDDNGMELLVNNKIISLDLALKEVYKKKVVVWVQIWCVDGGADGGGADGGSSGGAMRIVYRMRGLLGDATEEFIENLEGSDLEEQDPEQQFRLAGVMATCGGLQVMLDRLAAISDPARGHHALLSVLLKLFSYCIKVLCTGQPVQAGGNRRHHAGAIEDPSEASIRRACVGGTAGGHHGGCADRSRLPTLRQVQPVCCWLPPGHLSLACCGHSAPQHPGPAPHAAGAPPGLCQQERIFDWWWWVQEKMDALIAHFQPYLDYNRFDFEHSQEEESHLECFCMLTVGIDQGPHGAALKNLFVERSITTEALQYLTAHAPPVKIVLGCARSAMLGASEEWKEFTSKPALKYVLRLLTGLSQGHAKTQLLVSAECIPIVHRLEQVSSDERVGSLAENLMEAIKQNPAVATKIEEVRKQTRDEKKRLAMAMREKQLGALGMITNEKGQVTAQSALLKKMEDLDEETGLVCIICREGYKFQPTKVLGIYTYTKRCNVEEFEAKPRKTPGYTTVTHFNVVHVDCHMAAVRHARGRDEWESAALQNANTRCNGLLPLWGPQVPESAFANCLSRHNTYLQECTGHRDVSYSYTSTIHDLKLLLLRFANEKTFSDESGGGGPQSNMNLVPYLMHMALYVLNTARCASREEKNVKNFLELPPEKWVENCFE
ncbi:UBR4, partial [Cordylochernes scorpioides]